MSKETENRLKTELDKLDELAAKGVHLFGEYMNAPDFEKAVKLLRIVGAHRLSNAI